MKPISSQDYFQAQRCYGEITLDIASLTDFYLPLVGSNAFSTYLALTRDEGKANTHKDLVSFLGFTLVELEDAIAKLEAVGLVHTFFKAEGKTRFFVYCLYAPLHASEFNVDTMLPSTLKGKIGEEKYKVLLSRHSGREKPSGMEEISATFPSVFTSFYDYDARCYTTTNDPALYSGKAKPLFDFDSVLLNEKLVSLGVRNDALSKEELAEVSGVMNLYHLDMDVLADLVYECILQNVPFGKKLDRKALREKAIQASSFGYLQQSEKGRPSNIESDAPLSMHFRDMEELTPLRFLSKLQGGHKPSDSDARLVNRLKFDIGLPNPCINALLDYVLQTHDNQLPASYCEKIAASMVRSRCRSAQEARDYLSRTRKKRKTGDEDPQPPEEIASSEPVEPKQNVGVVTDEELEALFNDDVGDKK